MNVVVLILNYCSSSLSCRLAEKLRKFNNVNRIVIVDNNSPDGSFQTLSSFFYTFQDVDVIETSKNGGYSFGNNFGLNYIRQKYDPEIVVIANPDIDIEEKSLAIILDDLNNQPRLAIQTGVIQNIYGEKVSNQLWWSPSYSDLLFNQMLITYKIRRLLNISNYSKPCRMSNSVICAEAVPGCFFAIKMKAVDGLKLFDDDLFLYSEENVISFVLHKNELYAGVSQKALVNHNHVYKSEKGKFFKNRILLLRSYLLFIKKYLQKNRIQQLVFLCAFWIGEFERKTIEVIKRKGKKQ